jgi:hypothetical protein
MISSKEVESGKVSVFKRTSELPHKNIKIP